MAVIGYTRVSTEEQVDGTSLAEQRRQIAGLAMTAGLEGLEYIEDAGVSGVTPILRRPAGARLADLQRGDVVIVAKLDRLSRDLIDALTVIRDWEAAGVRLQPGGPAGTDLAIAEGREAADMAAGPALGRLAIPLALFQHPPLVAGEYRHDLDH